MSNYKYDKLYYEIYALLAMEMLYTDFSHNFFKGESPDWRNEVDGIGLEVSRAESEHIGYTKNLVNTYLGKHKSGMPEKVINKFRGSLSFKNEHLNTVSDSLGFVDGTRHIDFAIDKLENKTRLLNQQHFAVFVRNCLFLYMTNTVLEEDIELFLIKSAQVNTHYNKRFDEVMLLDGSSIHAINSLEQKSITFEIPDRNMPAWNRQALKLHDLSSWDEGTPFVEIYRKLAEPSSPLRPI